MNKYKYSTCFIRHNKDNVGAIMCMQPFISLLSSNIHFAGVGYSRKEDTFPQSKRFIKTATTVVSKCLVSIVITFCHFWHQPEKEWSQYCLIHASTIMSRSNLMSSCIYDPSGSSEMHFMLKWSVVSAFIDTLKLLQFIICDIATCEKWMENRSPE